MQYFFSESRILCAANAYKLRDFPSLSIFLVAFSTVFTQCSFFMQIHLQPGIIPFAKDTFYRFMNSCHKVCKSYLRLEKGCRAVSYDAMAERMYPLCSHDTCFGGGAT